MLRGRGIATELLIQLFSLHAEYEHIPVVLETRYDSDFYPITRALGFKNIIHDKFGYVIQVGPTYGELLQKLLTPSPEVSNEKNRFRHEAQGIL
ncbi:MAG: hypothetical protein H6767_09005 [Candidatus Peribacteria bacterium]|nr:MAG: hypothetical protein H6767_09005 [Candidatus Peribacteria bacterium]